MFGFNFKHLAIALVVLTSGCSTLTGIPSHGGGKRFAIEQRLVSASIRSTLKSMDVTPLRGKRMILVMNTINDEGGGNLSGGRFNILAGLTSGHSVSPVTSTTSQFQLFNLSEFGTSYSNTSMGAGSSSSSTSTMVQNMHSFGKQNSTTKHQTDTDSVANNQHESSSAQNSVQNIGRVVSSSTSSQQTNGRTEEYSSTSTNSGHTISGTSSTTMQTTNPSMTTVTETDGVVTTQNTSYAGNVIQTSESQSSQITGPSTTTTTTGPVVTSSNSTSSSRSVTEASQNTGSVNTSERGSSRTTTASKQSGSSVTDGTNSSNQDTTGSNQTAANESSHSQSNNQSGNESRREVLAGSPVATQSRERGHKRQVHVGAQYQGIGNYENFNVPKSDTSLLTSLLGNYLALHNVSVTTNQHDHDVDGVLYVTVDVFGLVRSRFDTYLFNRESATVETSIEMFARDRSGNIIMRPIYGNNEAKYDENYILWSGPFLTRETVRKGKGLLVDFSDVDGNQANYKQETVRTTYRNNAQ